MMMMREKADRMGCFLPPKEMRGQTVPLNFVVSVCLFESWSCSNSKCFDLVGFDLVATPHTLVPKELLSSASRS